MALAEKVPSTTINAGLPPAHHRRCSYPNLRVPLLELCSQMSWGPVLLSLENRLREPGTHEKMLLLTVTVMSNKIIHPSSLIQE